MLKKPFKVQAVAQLMGTTVDTVRRYADEGGIQVERQQNGPKTRLFSVENIYELAHWRHFEREKEKLRDRGRKKVIATIYAPKGGVGKTTLAHNLASIFPLIGVRTLVIDLDFQSNLTLAFGYDSELTPEEAAENGASAEDVILYHFGDLMPDWPKSRRGLSMVVKKPFGEHGPHLIPADLTLDRLDTMLTYFILEGKKADLKIASLLKEGLDGKNPLFDLSGYDLILFDAAPAKNRITRGALLASDFVITPVSMEKFSTKALSYLSTVLGEMREEFERSPELVIVGNFFDPTRVRVINQLMTITREYRNAWLETTIRRSEDFPKSLASEDSLPLALSKTSGDAAKELMAVARALMARMGVING
jgi:chromosome partitioning protein